MLESQERATGTVAQVDVEPRDPTPELPGHREVSRGVAGGDLAAGVAFELVAAAELQVALDRREPAGDAVTARDGVPHVEALGPYASTDDADGLRASGDYLVLTPDECVALAREHGSLMLHPLMGGLDPDLAWESLELIASKVIPRLRAPG